ncbi:hypothetical protein SSX86_030203 [Deinandra increscens subsp. villosa]|uniref:Uncharacterized protein n=1 Tax=Deinandra increscens subsp. villosa TaxID=3103831 RepID=A0AAP0CC06_9ASTR
MASGSRGRVPAHTGNSSSSRAGGPIRRVPHPVNSSTSKASVPYTASRSGDSRSLDQHHGYVGSTSHGGHADPLDDEDDNYAEETNADDTNEYSDDEDDISTPHDSNIDGREFVTRIGEKFAKGKVHRAIKTMFNEKHNGVWLTWKEVPKEAIDAVFDIFKVIYNRRSLTIEHAANEKSEIP